MLFKRDFSNQCQNQTWTNESHTTLNVLNVKWVQPHEGDLSAAYNTSSHRKASLIKEKN